MKPQNELGRAISGRKALDAFAPHAFGKAVIESDGLGPKLWSKARNAFVGAVITAAGLAATGAAADPLQVPGWKQHDGFLFSANMALKNSKSPGLFGGITKIEEDSECTELREVSWGGVTKSHLGDGYKLNFYEHLELPKGTDLTVHNKMKGYAECLRLATQERFGDKDLLGPRGKAVVTDVAAVLAGLRYSSDDGFFKSMAAVEASGAVTWVLNGTQRLRDESLIRLQAVGLALKAFENPADAERFRKSDMWNLPRIAAALTVSAEMAVTKANVHPDALYHVGQHAIAARLEEAGLSAAAYAASRVAGNGFILDDVCSDVPLRPKANKSSGNQDVLCPLRPDAHPSKWETAAEAERTFGTDATKYIDSLLPPKQSQTSALKR